MLQIKAGKVPGSVKDLAVPAGSTVLATMKVASEACSFTFQTVSYKTGGQEMMDVPFLNGRELCERKGNRIEKVFWDEKVSDGDIVLLVPKIRGNQIVVTVGRVGSELKQIALHEADSPEAGPEDGTPLNALKVAGIELGSNESVLVNGDPIEADELVSTELEDGDTVVVKKADPVVATASPQEFTVKVAAGRPAVIKIVIE